MSSLPCSKSDGLVESYDYNPSQQERLSVDPIAQHLSSQIPGVPLALVYI